MPLQVFDIGRDTFRPATQGDINDLEAAVQMLGRIRAALHDDIATGMEVGPSLRQALKHDAELRAEYGYHLGMTKDDLHALGETIQERKPN